MATTYQIEAEAPPLRIGDGGAILIGKTRVPINTVIRAFNQGQTPEAIVDAYSALSLKDTYAVIAHYLNHREALDEYVAQREIEAEEIRKKYESLFGSNALREKLLKRAYGDSF